MDKNVNIGSVILANGFELPLLGLGMYQITDKKAFNSSFINAIQCGYKLFDTAPVYNNEHLLGDAIIEYGISREDIAILSKIHDSSFGADSTFKSLQKSLLDLKVDYIDIVLIHWPKKEKLIETWKAIGSMYGDGLIKAIGVSNFTVEYLEYLMSFSEIKPVINQIEHHPLLQQKDLVAYCKTQEIQVMAHSPLLWGRFEDLSLIGDIASKYKKTKAQVILRWNIQKRIAVIPKSSNMQRIKENSDIFDFELTEEEMLVINSLDNDQRIGRDPGCL